jgi:hypothetical protein
MQGGTKKILVIGAHGIKRYEMRLEGQEKRVCEWGFLSLILLLFLLDWVSIHFRAELVCLNLVSRPAERLF